MPQSKPPVFRIRVSKKRAFFASCRIVFEAVVRLQSRNDSIPRPTKRAVIEPTPLPSCKGFAP
jgi:hypothetical protein